MNHVLPWRPRFRYGTGGDITDWRLRLPEHPWEYETPTEGGSRTAASGVPAGYVVRRDDNLRLTLRIYETEFENLWAMIRWGQEAETIDFYPDRDSADYFTVYLEFPRAGSEWRPTRLRQYPKVMEVEIVLRLASAGPWSLDYFPYVDA